MKSRASLACSVAFIALGGIACSSPEKDNPKLLDSKVDTPTEEEAAEDERMRAMQLIRVIDTSADPEEVLDIDPATFTLRVKACDSEELCSQQGTDACGFLTCAIRRDLCLSETLLAIASGTGAALEFELANPGSSDISVRVPPQTAATNAALAMSSAQYAESVLAFATRTLNSECQELEDATEFTGGASAQAFAATCFVDGFDAGKRAYRVAYRNTLAVSDAELSSSNQLEVARIRAIAKEDLSRTAAAHLMVGGQPGWFGSTREAFCTEGRLTGPEQAALAVLREAALDPSDVITEEITADAMVNGTMTGGQPHFGTVRQRLEDLWGAGAFLANRPLWEAYGLREADFQAALNALRNEFHLFGRSLTARLEPLALPGGQTPDYHRYAATAGKPPERPDQYWALLALFDAPETAAQLGQWRPAQGNHDIYLDDFSLPIGGADNLAGFVDRAYAWAGLFAESPVFEDAQSEVANPLRLVLGSEDIRGRFMHCTVEVEPPEPSTHRIRVAGYEAADNLVLVRGQDLMDCAVYGHIEGARCELPDILDLPDPDEEFSHDIIPIRAEETIGLGSFFSQVTASWSGGHIPNGRYYLIRPRKKGDPNPGPGKWELLLGTPLFERFLGGHYCRDVPIVPEAIEGAARAIAPSRDWCGQSEVSCAGVRYDERLPLEDELSSDGDDVESSWKHYLDLARRAVDHADTLGEEYVRASLDADLRQEEVSIRRFQQQEKALGEFQRVQEICGASVDPNAVLEILGHDEDGDLDLSNIEAMRCVPSGNQGPICGMRKLVDVYPQLENLAACLGTFEQFEETHLGTGFLCAANKGAVFDDDEQQVFAVANCVDNSPEPAGDDDVGPDEGCEEPDDPMAPSRYHCVPDTDGLGMYKTESLLPPVTLPALCEGIRQLRALPALQNDGQLLYDAIRAQPIYQEDFPRRPLNTVLDYKGGVPIVTVGNLVSSAPGSLLCDTMDRECSDGTDGLFCRRWNCSDPTRRAELNLRLYKAGAAYGGTIPTIWYLNHYVQPDAPTSFRQWTFFEQIGGRQADNQNQDIGYNLATEVGALLGADEFPVEGELPTIMGSPNAITYPHGNQPMKLAFRECLSEGLDFHLELLSSRSSDPVCDFLTDPSDCRGGEVELKLKSSQHEQEVGIGAVNGCLQPTESQDNGWPDGVCDFNLEHEARYGEGATESLDDALTAVGLAYFPTGGINNENDPAPATRRAASGASRYVTFGTQVFPPAPVNTTTTTLPVDIQARLDALEIMCELNGSRTTLAGCDPGPIEPQTVDDFARVGERLECLGALFTRRAATAVYSLPISARVALENGERVYDQTGGSLPVAISDLRASLQEVATSGPSIGGTIERFGHDLRALHAQLSRLDIDNKILGLKLEQTMLQHTVDCLQAGLGSFGSFTGFASAMITCGNAIAQMNLAASIRDLEGAALTTDADRAMAEFSGRASHAVETLETEGIRMSQALEGVQRNLEIIEGLQAEARRSMQSALWLLSKQAAGQTQISSAIQNIAVGKYLRYQRAFEDAQKMSFFAKRAIEMRIGMSLSDMVYDLPLVTAPASWEATNCQSTGINYAELRTSEAGQGEAFADAFLGEYVTKLEQVVESYRLVNNFQEGTDTTVVSLRDDVHNTRAACDADSPNLFYWASDLQARYFYQGDPKLGWTQSGCEMETAEDAFGIIDRPAGNCIVVSQLDDTPFFSPLLGRPPVPAWNVEFGRPDWCGEFCAYQAGAMLSQTLELEPGRYRFSWYTPDAENDPNEGGTVAGRVKHANGMPFPIAEDTAGNPVAGVIEAINDDFWNRVYLEFDVFTKEAVTVGFERPFATDYEVPLAAPLLEKLGDPLHTRTQREPPGFSDTTDVRKDFRPICEDTTGVNFRTQKWDRLCVQLCPDGYASDCTEQARTECFWETSFNVHQRSIEAGHIFNQSGFARGNFNYRIKSIGLNFVGTDLRACEGSSLPATCNAAGFIPYSILHAGPYYVRNHMGQDYGLALFPGRIEHARGLGTERYVTNPMSEADRTLLEPYMRTELNGRPLDGEFIIRIWDEPGVNFDAIQDVQLVIDYGYWTRFN